MITSFDSATESWDTGGGVPTFVTANARIGSDALSHTPAANATMTSTLSDVLINFADYAGSDQFVFAYNVGNANTANIKFRFLTDASNYYEFAMGAQSAGYKIVSVAKSAATVTGTPDWSKIISVQVLTTSAAGGASAIALDGIRINSDLDSDPNDILIAREVLGSPFIRDVSKDQQIQYPLKVAIQEIP
jgi:hypothetical protein